MGAWVYPIAGDNVLDRDVVKLLLVMIISLNFEFVLNARFQELNYRHEIVETQVINSRSGVQ